MIKRIQTVREDLDLITNKRRVQELQISFIEDPTLLQPLHNVLENIVREETNKQLEVFNFVFLSIVSVSCLKIDTV